MQARTDRRSSCSAEMFFAGAPSCVRLFFIQGNPDRLSTFMRAMLFPSCFLVFCGTGTPACANQCLLFATGISSGSVISTPDHSGILPRDPNLPLLVPKPIANLEIQPWFPRNLKLPQIPMLPPPTNPEKTCGTAPLSGDHLLFPGKACNRFCPDATGPGPASRQ